MNAWFLAVLDRSVIGAYVILIVLAVRLLLRSVPKKFTCLLWFAAFLALILPVSFSSDFSFRPDLSDVTPSVVVERNAMTMAQDEARMLPALPETLTSPALTLDDMPSCIWVSGALCLLSRDVLCWLRMKRRLREARRVAAGIYETDMAAAPFVFGLIHPAIYLPPKLSESACACVLAHERVHIARHDLWLKLTARLIVIVHWMNPFAHIAFHYMVQDMEMSCDEAAVTSLGISRKRYASALLEMASHPCHAQMMSAFAQGKISKRIRHVLRTHRLSTGVSALLAVLILCLSIGLLCMPRSEGMFSAADVKGLQALYDHEIKNIQDMQEIAGRLDFSQDYTFLSDRSGGEGQLAGDGSSQRQLTIALRSKTPLSFAKRDEIPRDVLLRNACALFALDPQLSTVTYMLSDEVGGQYHISYGGNALQRSCKSAAEYAALVSEMIDGYTHKKAVFMDDEAVSRQLASFLPESFYAALDGESIGGDSQEDIFVFSGSLPLDGVDNDIESETTQFNVQLSFGHQGLTHYTWKYYEGAKRPDAHLTDAQAQRVVDTFVKAWRKDGTEHHFVKEDLESNHRFMKGRMETWTERSDAGLAVIVVDMNYGVVAEASFPEA